MGGTNIDGVIIKDGNIISTIKNPVDKENIPKTVITALTQMIKDIDPKDITRINLSTTVSTNAIVQNKTSPVDLILQTGPGRIVEYTYLTENIYYINGYTDHRGIIKKNIDQNEIKYLKSNLNSGANTAIVTKFSTRNPETELEVADLIDKDTYTSLGHRMSGRLNFPRRVNTSYLSAAVYDVYQEFYISMTETIKTLGIECPIYILKADGGTMDLQSSLDIPVQTVLSGPAASFMGMDALMDISGDNLLIDIGGTTSDIFFTVDGEPIFEPKGITVEDIQTSIPAIYSRSIGIGGDSVIRYSDTLTVGPERLDRPAALGGQYPTLTDALVVLGHSDLGDRNLAIEAIKSLTDEPVETIAKIALDTALNTIKTIVDESLEELNSRPVTTIREVLEDETIDFDQIKIIGGPAKFLKSLVEDIFGLPVETTTHHHIANAIGAALSKVTQELNLQADTRKQTMNISELGIYEKINSEFAKQDGEQILIQKLKDIDPTGDVQIVDSTSFNMIDGYTFGKNIRIKAQIRPGLIQRLEGDIDE